MDEDRRAPDADVTERGRVTDDTAHEAPDLPAERGDKPEADVLEQSELVEEQQSVTRTSRPPDVSEADWLEQSVEESLDDDRR